METYLCKIYKNWYKIARKYVKFSFLKKMEKNCNSSFLQKN